MAEGRADPYEPLSDFDLPFDRFFVAAINQALAIFPKDRIARAEDWIEQIHEEKRRAAALDRARADKRVEDSIFRLVAETNEAVRADTETEQERETKAARKAAAAIKRSQSGARRASPRPARDAQRPRRRAPSRRSRDLFAARPWRARITFGLPLTAALWRFALRRLSFSK